MLLGLGAVAISTLLAVIIGILSGYYGGRLEHRPQRCVDTLMAFPGFVVLLTIRAMLGQGLGNVILALVSGESPATPIIRSAVLAIRENHYLEVARATGCRDWQIITRQFFPHRRPDHGGRHPRSWSGDPSPVFVELPRLRRAPPTPSVGACSVARVGPT